MDTRTKPPVTREAALRIALAARAMPNASLSSLIELLQRRLGDEIDEEMLRQVTVTMLKTGFASADGEEDGEDIGIGLEAMKLAARILWGDTQGDDSLPKIQPYDEGDMPGSVRVAVAVIRRCSSQSIIACMLPLRSNTPTTPNRVRQSRMVPAILVMPLYRKP